MFFDIFGFLAFAITALVVIGIAVFIGKFFVSKKDERRDPEMWKKFGLGLAIALIFPGMIAYGFSSLTTEPVANYTYDDLRPFENWSSEKPRNFPREKEYFSPSGESITVEEYQVFYDKYQDERYKQRREFDLKMDDYRMYLFITMIGFGIVAVVAGLFIVIPAASTGTLYGGILSVIFGYISYWSYMNEVAIFVSLLLAFITLFYVAYKKFKTEDGPILYGKDPPTKS